MISWSQGLPKYFTIKAQLLQIFTIATQSTAVYFVTILLLPLSTINIEASQSPLSGISGYACNLQHKCFYQLCLNMGKSRWCKLDCDTSTELHFCMDTHSLWPLLMLMYGRHCIGFSLLVVFFSSVMWLSHCFALVSLSEEQQDSRPPSREEAEVEEEKGLEEDIPLVALAPDVSLPEEQPSASADVSASPVFQWLDEVKLIYIHESSQITTFYANCI